MHNKNTIVVHQQDGSNIMFLKDPPLSLNSVYNCGNNPVLRFQENEIKKQKEKFTGDIIRILWRF